MAKMQEFKCPCCGGSIEFDSSVQKMKCPFCDTEFDVGTLSEYAQTVEEEQPEDMSWSDEAGSEWQDGESEGLRTYVCKSCGGEIVGDANTAATACPFCGSPVVMTGQLSGALKPDYVIPFKKSKKEAIEALKKHYEKKPLLPRVFKNENHIEEIKAVYVPFWLFDLDTAGRFQYDATRSRVWDDDDYTYTETSHYRVVRAGKMKFQKIPVDGSKVIDDTMMEAIEPYDYADLKEFNLSYLSGYMADKYDQEPDDLTARVYERMEQSVREGFRDSVECYETVTTKKEKITVTNKGQVKYGLFPVWFLNTKWNGQTYSFAMNGQTGHLIGDLPVGKTLAVKYWFKHHIPLTLIMAAIVTVLRLKGVI